MGLPFITPSPSPRVMQRLVVKPEARATRGYSGGLNGQRDARVTDGQSWLQVARMGSRNLPKVEK